MCTSGRRVFMYDIIGGIALPFIGTALGAACVLFMKRSPAENTDRVLMGLAAGIMTAASVWSLLIPAIEQSSSGMGRLSFVPAAVGFIFGTVMLMLTDKFIPESESADKNLMVLAVTIHNIPEGMAVGAVYAGLLFGEDVTPAAAFTLALGIAIQNFPEGAVVSMPLHTAGTSRPKAFLYGTLSGAVEPIAALLTIAAAGIVVPTMPYLLGFAAGAMMYVVTAELVPDISRGGAYVGTASFAAGFLIMMSLDVALG